MKKAIFLFLFLPSLLCSQEKRALTLSEAVHLGLSNNKAIQISAMKTVAADARSGELNASRLPSMKLQAGYTRLSEIDPFAVKLPISPVPIQISPSVLNNYSSKLMVAQPVFTGFRIEKSAQAAELAAEASRYDHTKNRSDLVYDIKNAYWNLCKAREVKRVIDENVEQMQAHVKDIENMLARGLATTNDVLKVQVQLSSTELSRIDAENAAQTAMMTLNLLIGLPVETELEVASAVDSAAREYGSGPDLLEKVSASRADLKAAERRIQSAEASATAAKGAWYPQVYLTGSYYYARPNPRIMPTKDEFKDTWDAGVSLSFDVWNWGTTKYQAEQAEAASLQSRYAYEQLKDAVVLEVKQSLLSLEQAKEKVAVAEKGVGQAEENHRIVKNRFKNGTATSTDLLDAETALLQAKLNLTIARVDNQLAQARMMKALGMES